MTASATSTPGARRLLICTGSCCDTGGKAQRLLAQVRAGLNDPATSAVAAASCLRRSCLGECVGVPVARLEPQGIFYYDPSPEFLRDIVLGLDPKPA